MVHKEEEQGYCSRCGKQFQPKEYGVDLFGREMLCMDCWNKHMGRGVAKQKKRKERNNKIKGVLKDFFRKKN